jgi:large subunit ribosomal protein L25
MAHVQLQAEPRTQLGSSAARRLRKDGLVPGVLYGTGIERVHFTVRTGDLRRALVRDGARNAVIDLTLGGAETHPALMKELQVHPVRGDFVHLDMQVVDLNVEVDAPVSLELIGSAVGVREGGILDQPLRELIVRALPNDIPESITFDVSELAVGDAVTVASLVAPRGVEILDDPETVVASVTIPRAEIEEPEVEPLEGEEEDGEAGEAPEGEDDSGDDSEE